MPDYLVRTKINQVVTRTIRLSIKAGSEEEATEIAKAAIEVYPEPIETDSIMRIVTEKAHYWIPRDVEFVDVKVS